MKVYHEGYNTPGSPERIAHLMRSNPRLLLIDTRLKPFSWRPGWSHYELQQQYGKRYRKAGDYLGNKAYKGGPIDIVDLPVGIECLSQFLHKGYDLLLLCQCVHDGCHRYVILQALKEAMPGVEIIDPDMPQVQAAGTIKCISVQQPWSYLIVNKFKDIENREWTTAHRGPLLIHAGTKYDPDWFDKGQYISQYYLDRFGLDGYVPYTKEGYPTGAIVGIVDLVDVVCKSESPWFRGKYGFVLANAQPFEKPIPMKGALKLFDVPLSIVQAESNKYEQLVHVRQM